VPERDVEVTPLFRRESRATRVVAGVIVAVPVAFILIGLFVPKAPPRARKWELNAVRFGEPSARPAP
jgi:hypothetical protein